MVKKMVAVSVVQIGTGTELGISDPALQCEMLDTGALIKLTNIGGTAQFRNKMRRAGKKPSRQ
jgi:hypothetical protein